MENVIVTGATGMIGASMIEQMVADGVHVTAVCRPNSKKRNNLIKISLYIQGGLCSPVVLFIDYKFTGSNL